MSSLPPLALPRFHVNALSQTHKSQTAPAQTLPDENDFALPPEDQERSAEAEASPDLPDAPLAPPPEIDTGTILNSLETAISALQKDALTHSQTLVAEFLRAAFPNLCEALLADEIVRATNAMGSE